MKAATMICRVFTALLAVAVLAIFFFGIVEVTGPQGTFSLSGSQLAFGSKVAPSGSDVELDFFRSSWYLFTMIFVTLGAICACCSFKWKGATVGGLVTGAVSMTMMLVFSFSKVEKFVDHRPISVNKLTNIEFTAMAAVLTICAIAFVVFSIITIFVNDYAEVLESNGAKKTLVKRFISFIREYKSEIKKIRWPDLKTVTKNTIIVLIVCIVVGAFIWLLDFGLGSLIEWLFIKK